MLQHSLENLIPFFRADYIKRISVGLQVKISKSGSVTLRKLSPDELNRDSQLEA